MSKLRTIWKDPVGSNVIGGVFLALVLGVGGVIASTIWGGWPAVCAGVAAGWGWLWKSSLVPHWLQVLYWLCAAAVAAFLVMIVLDLLRGEANAEWRSYRSDSFFGLHWRWGYLPDGGVVRLNAFCSDCFCQVISRPSGSFERPASSFYCEHCKAEKAIESGNHSEVLERVTRFIQRNLNTGEWRRTAAPNS